MTQKGRTIGGLAAATLLLLLMLLGIGWLLRTPPAAPIAAAAPQTTAEADAKLAEQTIRVGVYVSARTGKEDGWIGKPYGYRTQMRVVNMLNGPGIELIPVIEKGTGEDPQLLNQLNSFDQDHIEASDAASLRTLNVLIAHGTWRSDEATVSAFADAIRDGVDFINVAGIGKEEPGLQPGTPGEAISGLKMAQYAWHPEAGTCEVVASHPLLGDLKPGDTMSLRPNGVYGPLPPGAVPLLKMRDRSTWNHVGPSSFEDDGTNDFYTMYISQLGKGRIIGFHVAPYTDLPRELHPADSKVGFFAKLALWLVDQRKNAPTTAPAQ